MKIYIGADHNGFEMKRTLIEELVRAGHSVVDEGSETLQPEDDFPDIAAKVATSLKAANDGDTEASYGILICGSGQGVCMGANRFKGIRASLVTGMVEARAVRNDDDANVLCLPARYMSTADAVEITKTWLATPFSEAPRFKRRIKELDQLG
ncbi:MAG: RpiB/LacA/LacB family sugar-phosphate isomerase [Candidatus Saccharimonadales bacterium]